MRSADAISWSNLTYSNKMLAAGTAELINQHWLDCEAVERHFRAELYRRLGLHISYECIWPEERTWLLATTEREASRLRQHYNSPLAACCRPIVMTIKWMMSSVESAELLVHPSLPICISGYQHWRMTVSILCHNVGSSRFTYDSSMNTCQKSIEYDDHISWHTTWSYNSTTNVVRMSWVPWQYSFVIWLSTSSPVLAWLCESREPQLQSCSSVGAAWCQKLAWITNFDHAVRQ